MQQCGCTHIWMLASMLLMLTTRLAGGDTIKSAQSTNATNDHERAHIVSFMWEHVHTPYTVASLVLLAFLAKLVIEANHHVTNIIPESALLICFGFLLGGIILAADKVQIFKLTPTVFFFFLLPQIILDAGYFMPNKLFFSNFGTILVYAIIGTCWNAASLGLSLWGCHMGGVMGSVDIDLLQFLLFGSLISAVDPVAVFAVFEEVHVNEVLFILVFGESLLNDGVTVMLFKMFEAFVSLGASNIDAVDIISQIVSFFVVALGGSLLGVAFGFLLSLLTRFTKNIQIIEPGFIFVVGYLSYLTAEMLSLSAILATVFCGVTCKKYINANMDEKSVTTVKYAMKVLANGSETITFVFLGMSAIDKTIWVWNTSFIFLTLIFIFVYRFIGVFFLTWIMNKFRLVHLEVIDQIIMSYGGLRGAIAYGLAVMLDDNKIGEKKLMISTTLIVVYFTVIIQGLTLKPLVTWLKVKRASDADPTLIETVQSKVFEHMLVAIEDIAGQFGPNYTMDKWNHFEEKWVSAILMKPSARKNRDYVFKVFHQLNLRDAVSYVAEGERNGSLALIRNHSGFIEMEKKFGRRSPEADLERIRRTSMQKREEEPYVSLEMRKLTMDGAKDTEDFSHHLLQKHLYKARKQHRHRYSRSYIEVNKDKNEVHEIFRRTMKSRWELFKSAKMGATLQKTLSAQQWKNSKSKMSMGNLNNVEEDVSEDDSTSSNGSDELQSKADPQRPEAEYVRPTFTLEFESTEGTSKTEADGTTAGPSQEAGGGTERRAPQTPDTNSFTSAGEEQLPPVNPPPSNVDSNV
ncbi:sodium/hydrogen exchanger 3-like [Nerophis ophidion]|uniref:sodium/hydrogen exchanger 3-like n=1 Tax=Nerophis ophidion TaxID=159077 RepID=UPI002ADF09CB|nr:sodium/hydrogen exchanger 3-like [Nerophis ophidion]